MRKYTIVVALFLVLNLLFGIGVVAAQGEKVTPLPDTQPISVFDSYPHPNTRGALRYTIADKWSKTDLTFQFNNCPTKADCRQAQNTVRQAFSDWASVSVLTFSEISGGADIQIAWAGAEQDMGPGSDTLGFAYFPNDGGDMFLNDSIAWEFFTGTDSDLYLTAAHEIGHTLGLDHSSDAASLMYPTATNQTTGIAADDIQAIQALYGAPDGSAPTLNVDNNPTSVSSDGSSDGSSGDTANADGILDDNTPYDLWEVDVQAGDTLSVIMNAVDGDLQPHLGVLTNDENTVIAESWDDSDAQAVLTVTIQDAGTYVVMATRNGVEEGTSQGSYTLDIEIGFSDNTQTSGSDGTTTSTDNAYSGTVAFSNYTGGDVCELYLSPVGGSDWGYELLGGTPLADNNSLSYAFDSGSYDALAVTCDGAEIEGYDLLVAQDSSIEIYGDAIAVYP